MSQFHGSSVSRVKLVLLVLPRIHPQKLGIFRHDRRFRRGIPDVADRPQDRGIVGVDEEDEGLAGFRSGDLLLGDHDPVTSGGELAVG